MILAFNVHGVRVRATVDTSPLAERLRGLLGPFEAEPSGEADFCLDVRHRADPFSEVTPDGMEEHWRGTLPNGPPVVCYRGANERETLLPGRARMRLTARGADVRVAPGADGCLNLGCLLPALCDLLARCGHYVIHAATLCAPHPPARKRHPLSFVRSTRRAVPAKDSGCLFRALLLCGPSGAGKTTAALALAHAGLQLLTDDATFLCYKPAQSRPLARKPREQEPRTTTTRTRTRTIPDCRLPSADCRLPSPGDFRVWGLPRPCKVHRRTVALMPWLRPHVEGSKPVADEYLVELGAFPGSDPLAVAEPAAVVFLEPWNPMSHRLRPLDKVQAVARLADENVRAADLRGQGPAGDAFRALAALAAHVPVYLLSVGPDIESLPDALSPLLQTPR